MYPRSHTTNNSASATQTLNTWSKNQAYFYNRLKTPQDTHTRTRQPVPGAVSFADMAAGQYTKDTIQPMQSEMSSPTNSRSPIPSLREQQLEERIRVLEAQLLQSTSSRSPSLSTSSRSTQSSVRSVKTNEFQVIMTQQMQMIQSLADANKTSNIQMAQQMDIITDLRQTVAELVLKINDRDSDTSMITSSDQRKRSKISHNTYKTPLQRQVHTSNAGTATTTRVPQDPDPDHSKGEQIHDTSADDAGMSEEATLPDTEELLIPEAEEPNGGIQDEDILEHMAQTCEAMHTPQHNTTTPPAPCGHHATIC